MSVNDLKVTYVNGVAHCPICGRASHHVRSRALAVIAMHVRIQHPTVYEAWLDEQAASPKRVGLHPP